MSAQPEQADFACSATSLDDITVFLGELPPAEYEQRRRIRACRNAASFKVTNTESDRARAILWIAAETATEWIYAPADLERLTEAATFLRRLLIVAQQAEDLEDVS